MSQDQHPNVGALLSLGKIGACGVVVHAGEPGAGRYAYFPDNETESWRDKLVEDTTLADKKAADMLVDSGAPVAVLATKDGNHTILVNLNAFHGLKSAKGPSPAHWEPKPVHSTMHGKFAGVLIRDKKKYYEVGARDLYEMAAIDAGEARVLVRRGTIAAAIPDNDLPIGTNCVLVNLTQLLPAEK
jgi:hypothetical protein